MGEPTIRERFLDEAARFVRAASAIPGVRRIAMIGSIVTDKPNPKDIDLLLTVTDEADLAPLALCARRLRQVGDRICSGLRTCLVVVP